MAEGEAGAAALLAGGLPPAGEAGAAAGTALGVPTVVFEPLAGLPPRPPSIVKGPAKARSGEFPSSKASKNDILVKSDKIMIKKTYNHQHCQSQRGSSRHTSYLEHLHW